MIINLKIFSLCHNVFFSDVKGHIFHRKFTKLCSWEEIHKICHFRQRITSVSFTTKYGDTCIRATSVFVVFPTFSNMQTFWLSPFYLSSCIIHILILNLLVFRIVLNASATIIPLPSNAETLRYTFSLTSAGQ